MNTRRLSAISLVSRTSLFGHIHLPRRSSPVLHKAFIPNKIKFIVSPEERYQRLYPGMYFVIPPTLFAEELDMLERAILAKIRSPSPCSTALSIPQHLGRKLSLSPYDQINGFAFRHGQTFLASTSCVMTGLDTRITLTDLLNPEYGELFTLEVAGDVLCYLAAASSILACQHVDKADSINTLVDTWSKISKDRPSSKILNMDPTTGYLTKNKSVFGVDPDVFEGELCYYTQAVLCSFFNLDTDLREFLEWH